MATATVEFDCPEGLTLTMELYSLSTDTLISSTAATERTNDKGSYTASVVNQTTAVYKMRIRNAANNTIARGLLIHTNSTVNERATVEADVAAISTDLTAADNAESFFDGTGYAGTGNTIPSVTTVNGLATGVITAASVSAAGANKLADHVRRRSQANVEASSDGDTLTVDSHYGAIQMQLESSIASTTITIYKTDGTTVLGTKSVILDANAIPIRAVS